jgi:hypothetical protein
MVEADMLRKSCVFFPRKLLVLKHPSLDGDMGKVFHFVCDVFYDLLKIINL